MFTVCMVEYLYSCYQVLLPGIYKFQLRYAGEVQTLEFLLSVESPPVIKSFQKFPDFVSVRSWKVSVFTKSVESIYDTCDSSL